MILATIDDINRDYRQIYLQPHCDDAALSCGGTIALQVATGQRVLVVTIFGGAPPAGYQPSAFALQLLQRDGLGSNVAAAVQRRREEDAAAVQSLGADVLWLDLPEAIYRGTPAYYATNEALFGSVNPADLQLDNQITDVLSRMHQRAPLGVLYAPLGVGNHVDHQLVCSAADRLAQQRVSVKFYEDFPYVTVPGALTARQQQLGIAMEPELVEISHQPAQQKDEALLQYHSQAPTLFGSEDQMLEREKAYSLSIRRTYPGIQIERYWVW
jgi:LmbE family N-acetylglucosaminyl deacetylase